MLSGLEKCETTMVVYGKSEEEHNERLHKMLRGMSESGLRLSKPKCTFKKKEVEYFGAYH